MVNFNRPLSLGDIFSETFTLLRFTFTRSIIVILVFLVPAAFLLASGFHSLLNSIPWNLTEECSSPESLNPVLPVNFISGLLFYFFTIAVYLLLYLAAWIGLVHLGGEELKGREASAGDAFRKIFSLTYLKVLGLYILQALAVYGILLVPFVLIGIGTAMFSPGITAVGIILIFILIPVVIYIVFRWYFAGINIIITGDNILASFSRSSNLVKGYWWRTFGILFLLSLVFSAIISFVSIPFIFLLMSDLITEAIRNPSAFEYPAGSELFPVIKSFIGRLGYLVSFSTALQLLVSPFYTLLMYYDLRIRKDDIQPGETGPDSPLPHGEGQFI